jgi:alpha-tubulin suppressor-like RCC1 family protein
MNPFRRGATGVIAAAVVLACDGTVDVNPEGSFYTTISAGAHHTCGVTTEREAYCWGAGERGELGDGTGATYWIPIRVPFEQPVVDISAGHGHSCAVTEDGSLWCWGRNEHGQLGIGDEPGHGLPVLVESDRFFVAVSAGWYYSCALTLEGEALCWGRNGQGQLGTGDTEEVNEPAPVTGGLRFKSISTGAFHTCGLTLDGTPYCWGLNQYGQLGNGTIVSSLVPIAVKRNGAFLDVDAGYAHSCGIAASNGQLLCWGSSVHGEIGTGDMSPPGVPSSLVPAAAPGVVGAVAVSAGTFVSCAVMERRPLCWGRGDYGQVGVGTRRDHGRAQPIGEIQLEFTDISVGGTHACGVSRHSGAFCWGEGWSGQLGTGEPVSLVPVRVFGSGWQ